MVETVLEIKVKTHKSFMRLKQISKNTHLQIYKQLLAGVKICHKVLVKLRCLGEAKYTLNDFCFATNRTFSLPDRHFNTNILEIKWLTFFFF